jgi:uroporphyrinogen III methyltransferase / synthase
VVGRSPTVVLLSSAGALEAVDPLLRRAKVRLVRVRSVEPRPVDPATWVDRLRRNPPVDTVIVTSRGGVAAGVRPWRRAAGPFRPSLAFWAVGPGTARALRAAGVRHVHRPGTFNADGVAHALRSGPPRRIAYLRSDLAGSKLTRALRSAGHRVVDIVVYRLEMPPPLTVRERRAILAADLLVVTSPSVIADLADRLGRVAFARLARSTPVVVLGERSRQAAARRHFRKISVAPPTTAQRFTRHLLRELRDVRS